jgi:hypothetical protein
MKEFDENFEFPPGYHAALDQAIAGLIEKGYVEKCKGQDCSDPFCTGYSITRKGMWVVVMCASSALVKQKLGSIEDDALHLAWFFLIRVVNPDWEEVLDQFDL